ncbi:MAG: pantoate--beta-alanine ligase [Nocardioidaceae bacterium]
MNGLAERAPGRPLVVHGRAELATALAGVRREGGTVALVPTMGALHEGHAGLIRAAIRNADTVVVSVFVNPMQFAPGEDLDRYPRAFDADLEVCAANGAAVVFAPSVEGVYPDGEPMVTVDPGPLAAILEGVRRPAHFRGVLTVVAKLLGLVVPDVAVFGEKDYQQLVLIRRMVADLCLDVGIVAGPTVREPDGLALSSRNAFLDATDRRAAVRLSRALRAGAANGAAGAEGVLAAAQSELASHPPISVDYLALTSPDLVPAPTTGPARLLVAAPIGDTRLIDNVAVRLGE